MLATAPFSARLGRSSRPWASRGLAALFAFVLLLGSMSLRGAEVIPPAPENHFNDYARSVPPATAARLNQELAEFERTTSNQILVAVYPKMQSDSSVDDYATRVAQRWGVGQKDRKNGAVLFVFQESHDLWIATGYGLEGALPDALCKRIIEDEIVPRFRAGDFSGGLTAGVHAMMAATRGEYKGSGATAADARRGKSGGSVAPIVMIVIFVLLTLMSRSRRHTVYGRRGRSTLWMGPPFGGGGWGGGGGGGGGTFSGGGGSFGGGGAGGKW